MKIYLSFLWIGLGLINIAHPVCAQQYQLNSQATDQSVLPSGYDYHYVASVSEESRPHGIPVIAGEPVGVNEQGTLFLGTGNSSSPSWSAIELRSLWNFESGDDPYDLRLVTDLQTTAQGSVVAIGASTSPRAMFGGVEGTVWTIDTLGLSTAPNGAGLVQDNPVTTTLSGGSPDHGYSGTDSVRPIAGEIGSLTALPISPSSAGGLAFDRESNTVVGEDDFQAVFWTRSNSLEPFVRLEPSVPSNYSRAGNISKIAAGFMGGQIYDTSLNVYVPVIWSSDGSVHAVFENLKEYGITEMVEDNGSVVVLLNKGSLGFGNLSGPSYIYATGWDAPKALYGDILPASPDGESTIAVDIAPGGSLWVLAQTTNASGVSYSVYRLESSVGPTSGSWYNAALPADVNNDGVVNSLDALEIGDQLRSTGERTLGSAPLGNSLFIDTNNDAKVSVADLQVVIDKIFLQNGRRPISSVFYTSLFSSFNSSATTTDILRRKAAASLTLLLVLSAGTNSRTESAKLKSTTMLIAALDLSKDLTNVFSSLGSSSGSLRVPIMIFGTKTSKLISQSKSVVAKAKVGKKI